MHAERSRRLANDNILPLLLRFATPAMVATLVTSMHNVIDRVFVGRAIGSLGLAATTIAFPVMMITMACGTLTAMGTSALVSIRLGEGQHKEAERLFGQSLLIFALQSTVFALCGLFFAEELMTLFGATDSILPYAASYIRIILLGTILMSISYGVNNLIRSEGSPRTAMFTTLIGALLNICLDYLFVMRLGWGMAGAAWATLLALLVSSAWVLLYFFSKRSTLKIHWRYLRIWPRRVKRVFAMGSPIFAMHIAGSAVMTLLNRQLLEYGDELAVSAMGVLFSINMLFLMPIIGLTQGAQPIYGFNHGAGHPHRVRETLRYSLLLASLLSCLGAIAVLGFPEMLFYLFSANDPEFIRLGCHAARRFMLGMPFIGFIAISSSYFQAVNQPRLSLVLNLLRQVLILIPLLYLLPLWLGLDGVFIAGASSDTLAFLIAAFFIMREFARLRALEASA